MAKKIERTHWENPGGIMISSNISDSGIVKFDG
jgi:hypothetical protein